MQKIRRSLLNAALAAPALAAAGLHAGARARAQPGAKPLTFVLIHGAWHGGWVWERVADRLLAAGARVYAPTLTGVGERAHLLAPTVDLSTHVNDVVGELAWKDLTDVILVGHSYAGMVITGVAAKVPERLRSIVFLDAFVPMSGQSVMDIARSKSPPSTAPVPPLPAESLVNAADVAWVRQKMTPQPGATFSEPLASAANLAGLAKRVYIRATVDAMPYFAAAYQKTSADPAWTSYQIDCRHDAMLDQPEQLTKLLLACA